MADNNQASVPVPVPVPVEDERRPLLALLVEAAKPPPPASSPPIPGPCMVVFMWGLLNAVVFTAINLARYIILSLSPTPCTKLTWLFSCVTLTDEAADELWFLQRGELLCSATAAAVLAALLTTRMTTTTSRRWAVAVHALAWVALAATVGMHCIKVAIHHIILAADSGNTVHFVAFGYMSLAVDLLLAAVLLVISCSHRRL